MCKDEETRPVPFAGRNTISWNKNEVLLLAGRTSNVTDREEEAYERMWRFYEGGGSELPPANMISLFERISKSLLPLQPTSKIWKTPNNRQIFMYILLHKSIIIIIIIIEFLASQLWLGNIHLPWGAVINRIRLGDLICSLESFLQLNMCQELQIFAVVYRVSQEECAILREGVP